MALFFNGRLIVTPAAVSQVDDSALANKNLTVGNVVAFIGPSSRGKPNTGLRFGNPTDARAALGTGDLADAVVKAFAPSQETNAPSEVIGIRVNPATQSTLALLDASSAASINLKSTDYGNETLTIGVKVESGTNVGKKITAQQNGAVYTKDNITRRAFSIVYGGGEATASMSVSNTTVTLFAPNGSPVANIDLSVFKTYQALVDKINTVAGFTAAVLDGNSSVVTLNGLDGLTTQDVKTASYEAHADLQACVDWFNSIEELVVDAARDPAATKVPTNIPLTLLTGGSNGSITNTQWSNAFATLQGLDVQWLSPLSSDPSIHAMATAHVQFMSTVGKKERRALCGGAIGQTQDAVIAAAKNINSDRVSLCWPGHYDFDTDGNQILRPSYMTAALVAAAFSAVDPGTPMTNKALEVIGMEVDVKNPTDTDQLILGGVLTVENTPTGYRVVKSISTWLTNDNFNRVEVSTGAAIDFAIRNVRQALAVLVGSRGSPTLITQALGITTTTLEQLAKPAPVGPGVLVGDTDNPAFRKITISLDGDVLAVQFEASPVIPVNYIPVTMFATPFSATVST